ncbi:Regulatory protein recX [Syntrophobotulus glycolicus DSM 8271]|uniref:Regulatory protein RecX n=1 Tax=Syntrophobotulus glycolicus (strain DSM 8271 / FlGlyR) TaxID=645991 RepID=F0STX6_SYNGF|nr:regulatory protein RecX [Syntrophobotulus glycolicus]ADY56499.1 Regulatory protein recX [Syntrophobotulus glycolicus DSM 8271]
MKSALSEALKIISRRMVTSDQLETRLSGKNYQKQEIKETIEKLKAWNYLDDRQYAEAFCRAKAGKYSRARIRQELVVSGIGEGIISEVLERLYPEEAEYAYLKSILSKYMEEEKNKMARREAKKQAENICQKVGQRLYRKGYPYRSIQRALEESNHI